MRKRFFPGVFVAVAVLAGCQTIDQYREARVKRAAEAFGKIKTFEVPSERPLTLPDCIALGLKNNLDLRVYQIQQAVDNERRTAAMLGMLPDLIVSDGLAYRTNKPGAKSEDVQTGTQTLTYSQSAAQFENRVNVDMVFSIIDFGLAYFTSVQAQDKRLITGEEQRRAAQNLVLDITSAYLRVAAAQYEMERLEALMKETDDMEKALDDITNIRGISKTDAYAEQKRFINLRLQLREFRRDYENSAIQLRALMGYYPIKEIKVDTSIVEKMPNINLPDIELLEQIAILERPELYQLEIQQHSINMEARKKIITMFPNVQMFYDFTNSTNPYLWKLSWFEMGARAAYNLMKLPQKYAEWQALDSQADQIDQQVMALTVGILSQVRIAQASWFEEKERYQLYEKKHRAYQGHLVALEQQSATARNVSPFELARVRMEATGAAIERAQALGQYYLAYYRVLNSIGVQSLTRETLLAVKDKMDKNLAVIEKDRTENSMDYVAKVEAKRAKMALIQEKIDDCKRQIASVENLLKSNEKAYNALINIENNIETASTNLNLARDEVNKLNDLQNALKNTFNIDVKKIDSEIRQAKDDRTKEELTDRKAYLNQQYEKETLELNKKIEDASFKAAQAQNLFDSANDSLKDFASSNKIVAQNSSKLKSFAQILGENEAKKEEIEQEIANILLEEKQKNISYDDYIGKLKGFEVAINNMAKDRSLESDMNLEMSQNISGNLVTPEEYAPGTGDIVIQTQKDAGNNAIDEAEYQVKPSGGITEEMLYNTNFDEPNIQELNIPQSAPDAMNIDQNLPGNLGYDMQQNMPGGQIQTQIAP